LQIGYAARSQSHPGPSELDIRGKIRIGTAQALADAADLVDDLEGSAEYKRHLIGVFLKRAFIKALS
jgi:CO/xanthine dehydrogenase FAD-binding subunit